MADKVKAEEVAALLRRAAADEIPVHLAEGQQSWDEVYAGNVTFAIDGWRVTFFNDCGELDYTDEVIAPDGRTADFDEFCNELGDIACPLNLLSGEEFLALETIVEAAAGVAPSAPAQPSADECNVANRLLDMLMRDAHGTTVWPAHWMAVRDQLIAAIRTAGVRESDEAVRRIEQAATKCTHADYCECPTDGVSAKPSQTFPPSDADGVVAVKGGE
jgi:hypothetical protein